MKQQKHLHMPTANQSCRIEIGFHPKLLQVKQDSKYPFYFLAQSKTQMV